jgi:hypothetical protein
MDSEPLPERIIVNRHNNLIGETIFITEVSLIGY